ncbi:MAG: lipopolysaccharide assembly protein LapA domain-containing protein [Leptolyngbyaceae cyanobacterium]
MQKLLLVPLSALWIVAIAILSVQNATPISVRFLMFRSVQLPFGVVLSFCVAGGMLITALLLGLLGRRR